MPLILFIWKNVIFHILLYIVYWTIQIEQENCISCNLLTLMPSQSKWLSLTIMFTDITDIFIDTKTQGNAVQTFKYRWNK